MPFDTASESPQLILASASPRRRELLRYLIPSFEVITTTGETDIREMPPVVAARLPAFSLDPLLHPTLLAWRKAMAARDAGCTGVILAADTIVVIDGDVLGKPRDPAHARVMLRRLAGRLHTVYTGLVAIDSALNVPPQLALDAADVQMAPLSDAEIAAYVETGEPMDKAGAYGIQGLGGRLVQRVIGSYTCVVGLPLITTYHILAAMGVVRLADPTVAYERWLADLGKARPLCTAP